MGESKICNVCKEDKPLSSFYFRNDRGIYKPNCKLCKPLNKMADIMNRVATQKVKICKHCNREKPISEYNKAGGGKWLQPYCKPCDAIRKAKHREENIEMCLEKSKQYYQQNKEIITKKNKIYISNNKEKVIERLSNYRKRNIDCIRLRQREYTKKNSTELAKKQREKRKNNPQYYKERDRKARANRTQKQIEDKKKYDKDYKLKYPERNKKWRELNIDKVRERNRIWSNNKAATDINYRLKRNIRTRIRCALKPNNAYKLDTSEKLLGCTIEYYKEYFASLFTEGMNWERFMSAEIEIDHKIPCKSFDLTNEDEQRKCFHYTNTQPLWVIDNLKKGIKTMEQWKKMTA